MAASGPLVGQVRVGEREVVADRRVEQVDALERDREHRPDVVRGQLPHLAAAQPDLTGGIGLEPEQQLDQGRLAGAARADDREPAARRDRERQVVDDVAPPGVVREPEVADVQADGAR